MTGQEALQDTAHRKVVRIGSTVRRPTFAWSPAVHSLLIHLEQVNFPWSPRLLDVGDDYEILTFVEGESGPAGWGKVVDERGLRSAAQLLREYHDAVADWRPGRDTRWHDQSTGPHRPVRTANQSEDPADSADQPEDPDIVCHGDYGPWNLVWDGYQPVGILDWDYAFPAPARSDITYALEYVTPFRSDAECRKWLRYPEPPDRTRRMEIFVEAYGLTSTDGLVDDVIQRQRDGLDAVRELASRGCEPQVSWVAEGYLAALVERIEWSERHRDLFS